MSCSKADAVRVVRASGETGFNGRCGAERGIRERFTLCHEPRRRRSGRDFKIRGMRERRCRGILLAAAFWIARGTGAGQETGTAFVDSKICEGCHAAYSRSYAQSGMARSFSRAGLNQENLARGLPFHHSATGAAYSISARGGQLYQSRWQSGPGGERINRAEWRIDYVMGSGNHARTYLHRERDGSLIELPLAWYSEKGGSWGMNPGFDSSQFVAPRKISYECMFCHNAYPRIPAGHEQENSAGSRSPAGADRLPALPWSGRGTCAPGAARRGGGGSSEGDRQSGAAPGGSADGGVHAVPSANHQPAAARAGPPLRSRSFFLSRGRAARSIRVVL